MRWSALSTWEAGREAGLLGEDLRPAAVRRAAEPSFLPETDAERQRGRADRRDGSHHRRCAGTRAARASWSASAGDGSRVVERTGKDLREVDLLVGSGGVLRHLAPEVAHRILGALTGVSPRGVAAAGAPEGRASTVTTCSRRSACWPSVVPLPPRHWHVACRGAPKPPRADQRLPDPLAFAGVATGEPTETESDELRQRIAQQWAEVRAARRTMDAAAADRRPARRTSSPGRCPTASTSRPPGRGGSRPSASPRPSSCGCSTSSWWSCCHSSSPC